MDLTGQEVYLLQIVKVGAPHHVVRNAAKPLELELKGAFRQALGSRNVGRWKSQAETVAACEAALDTAIRALKWETVSL